jgi:hypothetical protein
MVRRAALVCLPLAGCTQLFGLDDPARMGPRDAAPSLDDAHDAAIAPIDAMVDVPGDAGPLATLTIPTTGAAVVSPFPLTAAVNYRIRAFGTFVINPAMGWDCDAEFYGFPSNTMDVAGSVDVGIAIDDVDVDSTRTPRWGTYAASHVYEVTIEGKGSTISINFHDLDYSNNSGTLTVEIWQL